MRSLLKILVPLISMLGASAQAMQVSLPDYEALPGAELHVPVQVDDVGGLAFIGLQINYDPDVLIVESVAAGQLGQAFTLDSELRDGVLFLNFVRAENMTNGGGTLAVIRFRANAGATTELFSDLAIAQLQASDESALVDLSATKSLTVKSGSVRITNNPNVDNAANGLPDWWELEHDLDPLSNHPDQDHDGDSISQLFELAFGGDPNAPDSWQIMPVSRQAYIDGENYIVMEFRRRLNDADGLTFELFESTDLETWTQLPIASVTLGEEDLGDGMRRITVRSSRGISSIKGENSIFLQLKISN